MSDSNLPKTNENFTASAEVVELQPKLKASGMRPDSDTSSMMGYDEHGRFDPFRELPAPAAKAATPATKSYDVDSSSMRGFTSGGPAPTV